MTWVRLDDGHDEHPKILALSDAAYRLWISGTCYCNRKLTDGFIPDAALRRLHGGGVDAPEIGAQGLWERVEGGWQVHDYQDYQPSKAEVLDHRERKQRAGRAGGQASAQARAQAAASRLVVEATQPPSRSHPVPIPSPIPPGDISPRPPLRVRPRRNGKPEPEGFPEFYDAHPKRTDRPAALKAWVALDPDPSLKASIMTGQRHYAEYVQREGIEYRHIKTPGPWLNGRRWEDEPPKPKTQTLKPLHPNQRAQLDAVRAESERNRQEMEREASKTVSREAQAKITELVAGMKPMPRSPVKNAAAEVERLQQWDKRRNQ